MFKLPDLPYAYDALAPAISAQTLHLHHDKHHAGYVDEVNKLLKGKPAPKSLEALITAQAEAADRTLFNNAAQTWNHAFYWVSMAAAPHTGSGELPAAIEKSFGSRAAFKTEFVDSGTHHFGSGWLWLAAAADGTLKLQATHDAGCLVTEPALTPLLVCDLWEHAYYLDHFNERKDYLTAWFDKLAAWRAAAARLDAAIAGKPGWTFDQA